MPEVAGARSVFVYVSFGSEVQTHSLIDALLADGKRVAVPKLVTRGDRPGRVMRAVPIQSRDELVPGGPGTRGILEPGGFEDTASGSVLAPEVVLVPGVSFMRLLEGRFARMGYGGGYYDRYLADHPRAATVGLAFTEQLAVELPTESHDVFITRLITG